MSHSPIILGAGMLFYAVTSHGEMYFLLGKEASNPEWGNHEGKWCDFIGTTKPDESDISTASREAVEETAATVKLFQENTHPHSAWTNSLCLLEDLRSGNYSHRISTSAKPGDPRQRVCYLKQIPWQPDLPLKFRSVIHKLNLIASAHNKEYRRKTFNSFSTVFRQHPAFRRLPDGDVFVSSDFLEKTCLRWYSIPQLIAVLQKGGSYDPRFPFRIGFTPTLCIALHVLLHKESVASFIPEHPVFSIEVEEQREEEI